MNAIAKFGILVVEAMFVVGAIGSAVVLLWVGVEDARTMLNHGEEDD